MLHPKSIAPQEAHHFESEPPQESASCLLLGFLACERSTILSASLGIKGYPNPRSRGNSLARSGTSGFTLLEVLIVITILVVLVGISVPAYTHLVKRAESAKCMKQMHGIWTGLNAYMSDHKQWPQRPKGLTGIQEKDLWRWWYEKLEPYDVSKELWLCPTESKDLALTGRDEDEYTSSYVPANFDGREFTPYRWDQPWLLERADFHGQGNNILMSDGTVKKAPFSTTYEPN